jgi:adenine-specific DNA methylase
MRSAVAVLHITYKHNSQTSKAGYDGFYRVMTTYQYRRLSKSHWTINTEELPQAVWQKFKQYIDPSDYFLMMPLDPTSFSAKDRTVLSWLAAGP